MIFVLKTATAFVLSLRVSGRRDLHEAVALTRMVIGEWYRVGQLVTPVEQRCRWMLY